MKLAALLAAAVFGALVGHALRRAVPAFLAMKNRSLPFAGPWMEGLGAAVFPLLLWRHGWSAHLWIGLVFACLLLAVTATDYLAKLIPDRLTVFGTLAGVICHGIFPEPMLQVSPLHPFLAAWAGLEPGGRLAGFALSLAGAALGLLVLEAVRRAFSAAVGMEVMGMGDSKLLMLMGAFLGPVGVLGALALAFFLGVFHGLLYLKLSGLPHSPFGPPLALGGLIVAVGTDPLVGALRVVQGWVITLPLEVLATFYTVLILVVFALLLRTRRRAAEYEELIEEDYRRVEEGLE